MQSILLVFFNAAFGLVAHAAILPQPLTSPRFLRDSRSNIYQKPTSAAFDVDWYKKTIFYQVYPASFQDGNGDGIGDLIGITQRLDHFVDIGVGAVWLSPIYDSPMVDNGYDVSNFTNINPLFGTLDDFDNMVREIKSRNLRLLMDLVPNHSSNQHAWFQLSRQKVDPYTDFYVWHAGNPDAATQQPDGSMRNGVPNNWISGFDGSAWQWDDMRQEYYYHAFLIQQPDFNYRSDSMRQAMKNIMRFWFDRGVDGFRVDAYSFAFEAVDILNGNETRNPDSGDNDPNSYGYYYHTHTVDQPETFENLVDWRNFIDAYVSANSARDHIFLVTECGEADVTVAMQYDTYNGQKAADFNFNFNLSNASRTTTGYDIASAISVWLEYLPADSWPNWLLGNHDNWRIADKVGYNLIDAMNMLNLLLPGTPFTYYGEEIGMVNNFNLTIDQVQDKSALTPEHIAQWWKYTRDYQRTPMQWGNVSPNANFTTPTARPYLPINAANLAEVNVADEEGGTADSVSHMSVYRQIALLRRQPAFADNKQLQMLLVDDNTFSFVRSSGSDKYVVLMDLRRDMYEPLNLVDFSTFTGNGQLTVEIASVNMYYAFGLQPGVKLDVQAIPLLPGGALVIKV